jgi:MFS family permease
MLSRVTPVERRNIVFSLKQSGVPLGGIFASFAFPFLAGHLGWHLAMLLAAALPLAAALIMVVTHDDSPMLETVKLSFGRGFVDEQTTIWVNPSLRTLSFLGFAYSAMQLSVSAFAVVTLVRDAGWTLLAAGMVAAAMQFAGAFGRVFWGVVADRIGGGLLTLSLLGLISGLCCVAFFWLAELPVVAQVGLFVLMGAISIGWNGVLLAEVARNAPQSRVGAITGGVLVYTFIGVIVGPSSFAMLYGLIGHYGASFLAFSLFGFAGMLVAFRAHRLGRIAARSV